MIFTKIAFRLISIFLVVCLIAVPEADPLKGIQENPERVTIEPGMVDRTEGERVSIILTASSSRAAAHALRMAGGRVTSELWLIDSVAGEISPKEITRLSQLPGVLSIVSNKSIYASGKRQTTPTPNPTSTPVPTLSATPTPTNTQTQSTTTTATDSVVANPNLPSEDGWVSSYRYPVPYDGRPDVQATSNKGYYKFVTLLPVDTGADQAIKIYNTWGSNVTTAVVDSGVYVSSQVRYELGQKTLKNFLGQADFISPICSGSGTQYTDYCFSDVYSSRDGYGHGSHVTGIIWSNLYEWTNGSYMGIAPMSKILSVRVLDHDGTGSYESVIKGIQFVVSQKSIYNIRVLNLSLSAPQTVPYFMDPLNKAVEQAWQAGIVVVAAAGNEGPGAETITVPGNDPYVITVGAVDSRRTTGYWKDDIIPSWSSSGPTLDGFVKPDILAPGAQVTSFMFNDHVNPSNSAYLVKQHPDYSQTSTLFLMNGTSMSTAVVSGVVALMVSKNPALTPDQVKYRLMETARQVSSADGQPAFGLLQQGAGRIWAPDAVGAALPEGVANEGMNLAADLAAGWGSFDADEKVQIDPLQISNHYQGPVHSLLSDDGKYTLYFAVNEDGGRVALGVSESQSHQWISLDKLPQETTWSSGRLVWSGGSDLIWTNDSLSWESGALYDGAGKLVWSGGLLAWRDGQLLDGAGRLVWSGGDLFDAAGRLVWSGGKLVWSGNSELSWGSAGCEWISPVLLDGAGRLVWSGGKLVWAGGWLFDEAGGLVWPGGDLFDAAGKLIWSGGKLVWSGSQLADAAGKLVWAGGRLVWSGGLLESLDGQSYNPMVYDTSLLAENLSWSSGRLVWSGGGEVEMWGEGTWAAGRLVWSGSVEPMEPQSSGVQASRWVDW